MAVFPDYVSVAGRSVCRDFIDSARKDGVAVVENQMDADLAVIWSVLWQGRMKGNKNVYHTYRSQNKPVIIIEVGALKRNVTWKICVNETSIAGSYWPQETWNSNRKSSMLNNFAPTARGADILICGQNPHSHNWPVQFSVEDWVIACVREIRAATDRQIHIRPHPRHGLTLPNSLTSLVQTAQYTFKDDTDFSQILGNYWAVVNYNSYTGIQARLHHCNAVVNNTSLAASVSHTSISDVESALPAPSDQWLDQIAHTEFYESEIANGTAWHIIKPLLNI